jgi:hypothetical protein
MTGEKRKLTFLEAIRYYPQLTALTLLGPAQSDYEDDPIRRLKRKYGRI